MLNPNTFTPDATRRIDEIEAAYPNRDLGAGARVTRVGPSPTGFMHVGGVYAALISRNLARHSDGVFMLRIEDTDRQREAAGASELIVTSLSDFGLSPDEGAVSVGHEVGSYGPYSQSARKDIYQAYVRRLLAEGKAYPCFATPEELDALRTTQTRMKIAPGYYGRFAPWRDRSDADVAGALAAGKPFVIRLRTPDDKTNWITLHDMVRGDLEFPTGENDIVLLKADGMPTYHLAHVVDDHLMGTTHVVRGSEWISSYPLHAQLFEMFGWERPVYAHIAPIEKLDGSSRRKLSKRSDPEASVAFYAEQGYPVESIIDYLMTLADSRFEAWRLENPAAPAGDWKVDPARMSRSGALFDMTKLDSVSRDRIGRQTGAEIYDLLVAWSENHDPAFADLLKADRGYAVAILDIERNRERARKDVAKWSDVKTGVEYFFDSVFETKASEVTGLMASQMPQAPAAMLRQIAAGYDATLPHEEWLAWMREMGIRHGYAPSAKTYKKSPEGFRGHFGDLAETMRVVLTGRKTAPDLHEVMLVLGVDRVKARVDRALSLSASLADSPEDPFDAGCEAKGPTA